MTEDRRGHALSARQNMQTPQIPRHHPSLKKQSLHNKLLKQTGCALSHMRHDLFKSVITYMIFYFSINPSDKKE